MQELTAIIREEFSLELGHYYNGDLSDDYIVQQINYYQKLDYDVKPLFDAYHSWQREKEYKNE